MNLGNGVFRMINLSLLVKKCIVKLISIKKLSIEIVKCIKLDVLGVVL